MGRSACRALAGFGACPDGGAAIATATAGDGLGSLAAIARSNDTRASITHALFATRIRHGILGNFDVTATGDTTSSAVTIYRVLHGRQVLYRVITPPADLVHPTPR